MENSIRIGTRGSKLALIQTDAVSSRLKEINPSRNFEIHQILSSGDEFPEAKIDSIGIGAGCADRLRELGLPVRGINVSEAPSLKGQYRNLRAELWFKAKEWLETRAVRLPNDELLMAELTAVRFKYSSAGKQQIESKEEIKRRGLPSPDRADAFVLTFAADASTAIHGGRSLSWTQPLKRHVVGVV